MNRDSKLCFTAIVCCALISFGLNLGLNAQIGPAPGGSVSGGNPTATATDTAVNGAASTYLRSDGAPAVQKGTSSLFGLLKTDGASINATNCNLASPVASVICAGNPGANGSNYWKIPTGINTNAQSGTLSATSTQSCFTGGVPSQTTMKQLGGYVITGAASSQIAFGLYYLSVAAGVITFNLIDNTNAINTTSSNADAAAAMVGNATYTLYPGVTYGWCAQTSATAGQAMATLSSTMNGNGILVGSTTLGNAVLWAASFTGWTKAITFGTWGNQTLNSGSGDMSETASARTVLVGYKVN